MSTRVTGPGNGVCLAELSEAETRVLGIAAVAWLSLSTLRVVSEKSILDLSPYDNGRYTRITLWM
jgi:hypothetical protein